ncbi:MAG: response regulator transcription factor [Ignavibacteria bacterium]|nr:response regulator transcription factor [Ignavibacteria bacterium]
MKKIRLFIIEDNRLLREGISALLKREPDMSVLAAIDERDLDIKFIADKKPDIILVDLGLSQYNSLDLVIKIKTEFPVVKIIIMDLLPIHEDILRFIEAGVSGFLIKDATIAEFIKTIRLVMNGDNVLPSKLTESLFSQIINIAESEPAAEKIVDSVKMTNREREIVNLISQGRSNKEIAFQLKISIFTVKSHVHNILEKMALNTRLKIAITAGKVPPAEK